MTIVFGAPNKTDNKAIWKVNAHSREVVAFCPRCKALETLTYNNEGITPTARFVQKNGAVYHGCGSDTPCRLYSLS